MILTNQNCDFIKLNSTEIKNIIQNGGYKDLSIELTKNCCSNQVYTTLINLGTLNNQEIKMFSPSDEDPDQNLIITGFWVKNIITGEEYNTIATPFAYSDYNCTNSFDTINPGSVYSQVSAWFTGNLLTPPGQTQVSSGTSCILAYTIVPYPFIFTRMTYTKDDVPYTRLFTGQGSSTAAFVNGTSIYINPTIISDTTLKFGDGVYTVKITFTKNNNSTFTDTSCIFIDCETRCKVAEKLNTVTTDTNLHLLYYALTSASNCGCQCDNMCKLYEELLLELGTNSLTSNCGCN